MNVCAWCKKKIPKNCEVFGLGAKVGKGIDLKGQEGEIISLFLVLADKTVPATVTTFNSEAKKNGYDLMFMTCSQSCAKSLKNNLQKEKDLLLEIIKFDKN